MTHYVKNCLQQKPLIMELPAWHFTFSFIFFSLSLGHGLSAWFFSLCPSSLASGSLLGSLQGPLFSRVVSYFSLASFLVFLYFWSAEFSCISRCRTEEKWNEIQRTRIDPEWYGKLDPSYWVVIIQSGHHSEWSSYRVDANGYQNGWISERSSKRSLTFDLSFILRIYLTYKCQCVLQKIAIWFS